MHLSCAPLTAEVGDGPSSFLRSDSSSFHMEVICSCACVCGGCRWGGGVMSESVRVVVCRLGGG